MSVEAGLCARCVFVQVIESSKGSRFYLCGLSKKDPTFRKYPQLPVQHCPGFRADSRSFKS